MIKLVEIKMTIIWEAHFKILNFKINTEKRVI